MTAKAGAETLSRNQARPAPLTALALLQSDLIWAGRLGVLPEVLLAEVKREPPRDRKGKINLTAVTVEHRASHCPVGSQTTACREATPDLFGGNHADGNRL